MRPSQTITEPIGMPPSARPCSASAIAARMNASTMPAFSHPGAGRLPAVRHLSGGWQTAGAGASLRLRPKSFIGNQLRYDVRAGVTLAQQAGNAETSTAGRHHETGIWLA